MPELPEVETVARMLRPRLVGRTVTAIDIRWARSVSGKKLEFARGVVGARVVRVWRRAKFVVCDLERAGNDAGHLVCHLRMTGRLHVAAKDLEDEPHLRARLELDGGCALHFVDVRKFGRLWFERELDRLFGRLGPEPLEREFTSAWLFDALQAKNRRLKPLLLDQRFVAGLGNIYVDESLFDAGLHPLMSSRRVPRAAAERLHRSIRSTLVAAIARDGSSFDAFYRTPEGKPGGYQDEFKVYDRAGDPCSRCGTKITRIVVGQRGTHFCASCQPRSRPATSKPERAARARASRSR